MTGLKIMKPLQSLRLFAANVLLLFAVNVAWGADAATNSSRDTVPPHRLAVQDFMGTWKVFARTPMGGDFLPEVKNQNDSMIGKTITFRHQNVQNNFLFVLPKYINNPIYSLEYKKLHSNTPHPNVLWLKYPHSRESNEIIYFIVRYKTSPGKQMIDTYFEVGSDYKIPGLALSLDMGNGTAFFLCKLNPKTGKCQDHP